MNKVICDICGTAYPETASQCPICGNARQLDHIVAADTAAASAVRPKVRGGRFSKANVRKRNKANKAAAAGSVAAAKPPKASNSSKNQRPQNNGSNKGLVITAIILLIAIIFVVAFILLRFVFPASMWQNTDTTTTPATPGTSAADTTAAPTGVACTELKVDVERIELDAVGRAWLLSVKPQPADTTDEVVFTSSDEKVVTVSAQGRVTAVGEGEAVIMVTCGSVTKEISVSVAVPEETKPPVTTKPVEETTAPTTEPLKDVTLTLDAEDISFGAVEEFYEFGTGELTPEEITWSSDNDKIAKVENGVVTAVAPGTTTIRAKYGDQEVTCIVRCNFEAEDDSGSEGDEEVYGTYTISDEDVTISVDETFTLKLRDEYGNAVDVTWTSDDTDVCTVSGNTVTGVGSGVATVSTTYGGQTYSCTVRVG